MKIYISIVVLLFLLAGLVSFSEASSEIQAKLDALEAAYKAGILSEEEYTRKKAEMESQLRAAESQLDEATKQKIQALDAARDAGILSEEEYARKKAELMAKPAAVNAAQYQDPQGRFQFQYPGDWKAQALQDGRQGVAITRGNAAINVMPLPDGASAQQVLDSIVQQISGQWKNFQEISRGQIKIATQLAPMVEFTGVNPKGLNARSQVTAFVSGIKGYLFILIAPEGEPANNFSAVKPVWEAFLGGFTLIGMKGKIYKHPVGFSFLYPDDWTVTDQEGTLQIVPPNASSTDAGPTELYFVSAEDISEYGIQNPDDPMVLEYLDMQIQSMSPALQRTGQASPIDVRNGKGAFLDWGAQTEMGSIRARVFVSIIKNHAVMMVAMGLKDRLESRDAALRQMFATFGVGDPKPQVASSAPDQVSTGATASPDIGPGEVGDPNMGFKFKLPTGWKAGKVEGKIILGHDTIAGMVVVMPHMAASFQEVQAQMQSGLSEEGVQLALTGALQPLGSNAVAGEYSGIADGQAVKARGIGTFSPHGGGAYIVALTVPDKYGPQLSSIADAVAQSMVYFKVDVSELVRHFAGTWASYANNTLSNMTLAPDGRYFDRYESSYSGDFTNELGDVTGNWGAVGQDKNQGRWTVRGNKQQGVIIVTSQDGTVRELQYRVFVEKGETYWREYIINGSHYIKQKE